MEQYENIYDKIQELLGCIPGNVTIMEQQIDAEVQLEYYNCARAFDDCLNPDEVLKKRETLFRHDLAIADKKHLMIQLANIDSIEAYRTLEKYINGGQPQLKDWAMLALQECRLLLESRLLDKSQVLISTGLGGKGMKLRYFTVLLTVDEKPYSSFQQKIIADEIQFAVNRSKGELEQITFDREICTMLSIIPLQVPVQALFDELIRECNQYGDFINRDYIITNVKIIPNMEIRELIGCSRHKNKARKV